MAAEIIVQAPNEQGTEFHRAFWGMFVDEAEKNPAFMEEFKRLINCQRAYFGLTVGVPRISITLTLRTKEKRVGFGIYFTKALEEYREFEKHSDAVEREIHETCPDCEFQWRPCTSNAALRCFVDADVARMPKGDWPTLARQLRGYALLMKQIIQRYLA